jgi:glycosyltransferase involved in cell wall biosynthesis
MKKKIFHISLKLSGGGAEQQLVNLAIEQKKHGYDVLIFSLFKNNEIRNKLKKFGIRVYSYQARNRFNLYLWLKIFNIQKKENPFITCSWTPTLDFFTFIISKINKKKYIIFERTSPMCYENFSVKGYDGNSIRTSINKSYITYQIEKILRYFALNFSELIICNSKESQKYHKKNFPKKKIFQINNIINNQKFSSLYLNKKMKFICISRLIESKNLFFLIDAFNKVKKKYNYFLDIYGEGELEFLLKEKINDLKLSKYIKINKYKKNWYHKFSSTNSCLIHPSIYEGQSNVVIEAANYKIPMIISNIPSHSELFSNNSCFLFDPYNIESLLNQITRYLSQNTKQRKQKITVAKKIIKKNFLQIKIMNKYKIIFKNLS